MHRRGGLSQGKNAWFKTNHGGRGNVDRAPKPSEINDCSRNGEGGKIEPGRSGDLRQEGGREGLHYGGAYGGEKKTVLIYPE